MLYLKTPVGALTHSCVDQSCISWCLQIIMQAKHQTPTQEEATGRRFVEEGTCKSKHVLLNMLQIDCCHLCWQVRHMQYQGSDVVLPFPFLSLCCQATLALVTMDHL